MAASMSMAGCSSASAPMKNFKPLPKTILALGEAVPCRPGGTTAKAYKRSKGTNNVAYTVLALQKK